jgi:hypothetical protein
MKEVDLLRALSDSGVGREEFAARLATLQTDAGFAQTEAWTAIAKDPNADAWRRLAACRIVLEHCLSFPLPRDAFVSEAIRPMGIPEDRIRELQIAQFLPIERMEGERVFVADTAIRTSVGPASIYFTVDPSTDAVQRAAIYPAEELSARSESSS